MNRPTILITGANGQVGLELQALANSNSQLHLVFTTRDNLPIENADALETIFKRHKPQYLINAAAYTAVDKAESEKEKTFLINAEAVSVMASICKKYNAQFIHISTDYVFDGNADIPYSETSIPNPGGIYGSSKLKGEKMAVEVNEKSLIVRTSWVYSAFGKNFVKTMIRLMKEKPEINVVNDQFGSPTYAADLAETILFIISKCKKQIESFPGIYHYSNKGIISWYEFALAIKELTASSCRINQIKTSEYPTAAKRPAFSALNTTRIQKIFGIEIKDWKASLAQCLQQIKNAP